MALSDIHMCYKSQVTITNSTLKLHTGQKHHNDLDLFSLFSNQFVLSFPYTSGNSLHLFQMLSSLNIVAV